MAYTSSFPAANKRRSGVASRFFVVLVSVLMTVSPSSASLLAAEEPQETVEEEIGKVQSEKSAEDAEAEEPAEDAEAEAPSEATQAEEPAEDTEAVPSGIVQGVVWADVDGDGVRQSDEEGLGGVELVLFDGDDQQIASTVSSGDGTYSFDAVAEGSYRVHAALPEGYVLSPGLVSSLTDLGDQAETEPFDVTAGQEHVLSVGLSPTTEATVDTTTTTIAEEGTTEATEDTTTTTAPSSDVEAPESDQEEANSVTPLAAGPPVFEIEGDWVNPPATIGSGNPVVAEWRVNVNDSGEPPSNDPVDNVIVDFTLDKALFDGIPDLCLTEEVDPPSSISAEGTVLTCNLGTVDMGTAIVVQTPVVADGITGEEVTHDGTIDGQTVDLPPIPIANRFVMDIHYGTNTSFREWNDDFTQVDVDVQWSLRLGTGSDPGPPDVTYRLTVTDVNGNPVNVGTHPRTGEADGCTGFDLGLTDGHPWSRTDLPPEDPRNGRIVDSCILAPVAGQPGVFDLTLQGIDYSLLNVPTNDTFSSPLPPNFNYIASGSLWFRINTTTAGSIQVVSNAPTYTAPTGQTFTDPAGNNTTNKSYTLPGNFAAWYQRSFSGSGGTAWDDTFRTSAGTLLMERTWARFAADNAPPASPYGSCLAFDTRFMTLESTQSPDPNNPNAGGVSVWSIDPGRVERPRIDDAVTIEFYVGNHPLVDPASPQYDPDQFICGVDPGNWTETPTDMTAVKAVRITYPFSTFAAEEADLIELRAIPRLHDDVPVGEDVWMFGSALRQGTWIGPENTGVVTETPGADYPHTNGRRDIVRIIGAVPFLEKEAAQATVTAGVPADFTLTYSANGAGSIPDTVDGYEIVDTLPLGMTYEPDSADSEPEVDVIGGQQVLTWTFNGVETNVEHELTYQAVADTSVEPGTQLTNTAVSNYAGESSPEVTETVTTTANGYTIILKTADVEFIPNDAGDGVGTGSWTVAIESFDPISQAFTDTIDILPYNGDQRGTSFSGTYTLDDVVVPAGATVYYTDADPTTLSDDPEDPSNGAAGDPTGNTVGWTTDRPANPTAIRVIGGELPSGGEFSFQVVITTDGAAMGDVYVNRAQARAEHTELVMRTSAALVVTDYVVVKTSDPEPGSTVSPGDTINYTITVTQQGPVPAGALLTDTLDDVVDDAFYNDDLAADFGNVSLVDGVIHWDGILPVGGVAHITYSVTVKDIEGLEADGDTFVDNVVWSPGCVSPEDCNPELYVGWYEYSKTSVPEPSSTVQVDELITYMVEITQRGDGAIENASINDDLSAVLDDAEWNNDIAASAGETSLEGTTLTWSTDLLEVGEVVTLTYSVTVTDTGDSELANVVTSPDEGTRSRCVPAPDENPDCMTDHRLGDYEVIKISDPMPGTQIDVGDVITYTITVSHVGAATVQASFEDDLSAVLDDARWNFDLQATDGETSFDDPFLNWNGHLSPGDEVTVTYSVTATDDGDRRIINVVNTLGVCVPAQGQDQSCVTDHAMVLSASTLPFTGFDMTALLMSALALVVMGAFINRAARHNWLDETPPRWLV